MSKHFSFAIITYRNVLVIESNAMARLYRGGSMRAQFSVILSITTKELDSPFNKIQNHVFTPGGVTVKDKIFSRQRPYSVLNNF